MFNWIVTAYRRLEAAITREAASIERTAELREQFNLAMESAMSAKGINPPPSTTPSISNPIGTDAVIDATAGTHINGHSDHAIPNNRITSSSPSKNGRSKAAPASS